MRSLFTGLFFFILVAGAFAAEDDKIKELEKKVEELQQQIAASQASTAEIEEIRRQLLILAEEVEKLRNGEQAPELSERDRSALGLGPSAATVYSKKEGVSIAGYGEMLYENFDERALPDQIDFLRGVFYVGYRFNDRFLFNSEVEFEHANTEDGGEAGIEFAHIDFRATDSLTVRGGMVLMPLGFINEFHEPNAFLGARRPLTETVIIPTTWRENGFGVAGRSGMFVYRVYLTNGMKASGFSAEGLAEGKQEGALAKMTRPAFSGRLEASPRAGFLVGGSLFAGNSGFFDGTAGAKSTGDFTIKTWIGEVHGEYRAKGLEMRALFASASLGDVERLNRALGFEGSDSVGKKLTGGYAQIGYNIFARNTTRSAALIPFLRFESVNTQARVPAGFTRNPANAQTLWTLGVQYLPIPNIVLKFDDQIVNNDAGSGLNQWNLSLGYSF